MERTEEEKILHAPIVVILGGEEHKIAPLVLRRSGEWRKKYAYLYGYLIGYSEDGALTQKRVTELFTTKMDEVIEGFFAYAWKLNREDIEEVATDGEVLGAFLEVLNAFVGPLSVKSLKTETVSQ